MADQRLTDKGFISSIDDADLLHVVDVSDTTANAEGTSKKSLFSLIKSTLKTYFDTLYQVVLVSGTNIKTVNNQSLLGSGNLDIDTTGAVDSVNTQTGVVVLDADDIDDTATINKFTTAADIARLANTSGTNTGDQDISGIGVNAGNIATNVINISTNTTAINTAKATLTANPVSGALDLDWSLYSSWIMTLSEATTLTESNVPSASENKTITLYVTGDFALTIPVSWTNVSGTYNGTVLNQIVVEKAGTIYWVTIN